jgi:ATP-binding cassette subfamily B protein
LGGCQSPPDPDTGQASIQGEIRFKQVAFGYQPEKPILKGVDLVIPAASWVAIVGPSGCGKTTLVNLILRLYEPWQGEIFLDDTQLRMIKLKSLRERVGIATQQPLLFDVSIRENITYGLKDIPQADIEEATQISGIADFIRQLPQGYATLIGEDACRLSQGLKQRLAIARAVLRNPGLLILDEATSSVDSATEEKIFQALRNKRQGLSTIVISHRLFSVKDAQRVYFFRADNRIEAGRHSELLAASQAYRDFFHHQMEEEVDYK